MLGFLVALFMLPLHRPMLLLITLNSNVRYDLVVFLAPLDLTVNPP
jgi:hypothetical protein